MKVLTVGDVHLQQSNVIETDEMIQKLVKATQEIKPRFVVIMGDVLHRHEKIHVIPLMRAEHMLSLLSEICHVYLLIGNHDRPNNSNFLTDEHPFNALKKWPNMTVVDKTTEAIIDGNKFVFTPYVSPGRFEEALNTIKNPLEGTRAIFCHQEFYGAKMGAIKSQAGDKWPLDYPFVISGHVHDYDQLQPNLIYTGTPLQSSFGDNDDKTISLYTFNPVVPEEVQGKFIGNFTEQRIDLGLIRKITVYITPEEIHTYEPVVGKMIKLIIRGEDADLKSIAKLDKIKSLKRQGIRIAYKPIPNKDTEKRKGPTLKLTFKDRLYVESSKDPSQLSWFNTLFKSAV